MALSVLLVSILIPWTLVSPAPVNDEIDVNKTLQNVQAILDANPLLPRLTQEEILILLKNITAEDELKQAENSDIFHTEDDLPGDGEKIMVVLPFQPSNSSDVTELFTKRPIIKYVSSYSTDKEETTTVSSHKKKKNKPKKATSSKTDESKDLLKSDLNGPKYHYSLVENVADFNYQLADQHSLESANIAYPNKEAYQTFQPIPEISSLDQGISPEVRDILKSLEKESGLEKPQPESPVYIPKNQTETVELVDSDLLPSQLMSMLGELGLAKGKEKNNNGLANGPDPMGDFSFLDSVGNDIKKRQQSNSTGSSAGSAKKEEDNKDKDSKEKNKEGPKLADLESSFGGSSADDDPSEAVLPPPRRNGFYYMVDWNSFLEVGDGDTKVNIRFEPKLGDPQRFIAVNVP